MKIVVIGATGVIGSEVVKLLSERHDVLRCGRTARCPEPWSTLAGATTQGSAPYR